MPDVSETLVPNSSQLDNIDLRGGPPRIFTVASVDVRPGVDQPVHVHLVEFDRPWKPGKNMRRVLAYCWGRESDNWIGQRVELFADEKVTFGKETPGGTRISRLSGIDGKKNAPVLLSQGRAGTYPVDPLPAAEPQRPPRDPNAATDGQLNDIVARLKEAGVTEKAQWLAYCVDTVGRDLSLATDLTTAEASQVIDALKADTAATDGPSIPGVEG